MVDDTPSDGLRIETTDAEHTAAVGRAVGSCCVAGDVIALEGELGAGKTQFVRGLAEGLGLDPRQVSSPTFVIMQEYVAKAVPGCGGLKAADGIGGDRGGAGTGAADAIRGFGGTADGIGDVEALIHMDAYRLRSAEDLASVGWEGDGASLREGAVLAIEWASLLGDALPSDRLDVRIEHEPAGRAVFLTAQGGWGTRIPRLQDALGSTTND